MREDGAVHVVRMQLCDFGLHCSRAFAGDENDVDAMKEGVVRINACFSASRRDCGIGDACLCFC